MQEYSEATAAPQEQSAQEAKKLQGMHLPNSALLAMMAGQMAPPPELRGRQEELSLSVAAKMTNAFGMDVRGVKVYRSDALKDAGMEGLASGDRVVLSSDVDLATLRGQEILGHELSHIRTQSMGIGLGRGGLLRDKALEHRADVEGERAARGESIFDTPMQLGVGITAGFGMDGVENLTPLSAGLSASAGAPMQAKKGGATSDDDYVGADEDQEVEDQAEEVQADEEDAGVREQVQPAPAEQNMPVEQTGNVPGAVPQEEAVPEEKKDGVDPKLLKTIPLAWGKPSLGAPEEPPKLHVFVKQQERGDKDESSGSGFNSHTFLGLEYSKKSAMRTGERQGKHRFLSCFGFYPKLKIDAVGQIGQGGTAPGQLLEDSDHGADMGKSFPISYQQVNSVARYASTYEQGGYNLRSRNCTTFAADATQHAGINVGNIFREEDWSIGVVKRIGYGGAKLLGMLSFNDSYLGELNKRMQKDDMRFGVKPGTKLVTQEEKDRFIQTRQHFSGGLHGYMPTTTGNRMQQLDPQEGDLSGRFDGDYEDCLDFLKLEEQQKKINGAAGKDGSSGKSGDKGKDATDEITRIAEQACQAAQKASTLLTEKKKMTENELFGDNRPKAAPEDYKQLLGEMDGIRLSLKSWGQKYAQHNPALSSAASDIFGAIDLIATELIMYCSSKQKNIVSDDPTLRAYAPMMHQGGSVLLKEAQRRTFGGGKKGAANFNEYQRIGKIPEKKRTKEETKKYQKLSKMSENQGFYFMQIIDEQDEEMDRLEANGVNQQDMDEAFITPVEEGEKIEQKDINVSSVCDLKSDVGFSELRQEARLRMLFGEEPGRKTIENDVFRSIDEEMSDEKWVEMEATRVAAINVMTAELIETKDKEVRMLVHSMVRDPACRNLLAKDLYEFTMRVYFVLQEYYCYPLLLDLAKTRAERGQLESCVESMGLNIAGYGTKKMADELKTYQEEPEQNKQLPAAQRKEARPNFDAIGKLQTIVEEEKRKMEEDA